ncbi:DUF982 domain-containing protein [Aquamicrobium sp. LC103]|uniref:DUF982 domain-containing protein n=1 Tax=Aquamicrobium sp. LC103 TaxID=1120658 RepID=UPI00063E9C9A|nr:DUF982 domain-containing protein [Aquamicrobium sp. LC103]
MSARSFHPVVIFVEGRERVVADAFEAMECLTGAWPVKSCPSARKAIRACQDALDGIKSAAMARAAFIAAARDAGVAVI